MLKKMMVDMKLKNNFERFEVLKYSILLEELIKKKIIEKILYYDLEKSFDNIDSYYDWKNKVSEKLKKFSKKNGKMKETIFHCSAKELIKLFALLKFEIRNSIYKETFLKDVVFNLKKFKRVLTGNKLLRDICAHPTYNIESVVSKLTIFTFIEENDVFKRIEIFYNVVKNNV